MAGRKKPLPVSGKPTEKMTGQALAAQVNALLGTDAVTMGSDPRWVVEYLPTGVLPIDVLLEGGLPRGRFTEIFGDHSTLKSYVGMRGIAAVQSDGGTCALVDTEHAFDPAWAEALGIDLSALVLLHPPTGEAAIDATEVLIRQKIDLVVWDSIAATLPKAEQEKMASEKQQQARLAAMMSSGLRKLNAANSRTAVLWINQTRHNVGQMFGDVTTVPGGRAMPYYASYRVSMKKAGKITRDVKNYVDGEWRTGKEQVGFKVRAGVEKSKLNAPFRDIYFVWDLEARQIDEIAFLIAQGLEKGLITQKGQMWKLQGSKTSHRGAAVFRAYIEKTPRAKSRLRVACLGPLETPGPCRDDEPSAG